MSSIVYVTDNKMIEYHRLNGNTTMNFWRLSSQKNFSNFIKGDLLFFYTKERALQKERSIAGFGVFKEINKLTLKKMWDTYGSLNGYSSKKELEESILKASKNKAIPKYMNCIYLEDVIFFQNPIYLSEFGLKISNKLESYFYLDKEDEELTTKILSLANKQGIDLWSIATGKVDEDSLEDTKLTHNILKAIEKVKSLKYDANIYKIFKRNLSSDFIQLREKRYEHYKLEDDKVIIALPFIYSKNNHDDSLKRLIGHIMLLKYYFGLENINYEIEIITEGNIEKEDMEILKGIIK